MRKSSARRVDPRTQGRRSRWIDVDEWKARRLGITRLNINRAARLKKARVIADVTQADVGEIMQMTGAAFCYWECGKKNLSNEDVDEALKAIARASREVWGR